MSHCFEGDERSQVWIVRLAIVWAEKSSSSYFLISGVYCCCSRIFFWAIDSLKWLTLPRWETMSVAKILAMVSFLNSLKFEYGIESKILNLSFLRILKAVAEWCYSRMLLSLYWIARSENEFASNWLVKPVWLMSCIKPEKIRHNCSNSFRIFATSVLARNM